jgi:methylated-DNA-[protein]-cysteine S-methyltransferase
MKDNNLDCFNEFLKTPIGLIEICANNLAVVSILFLDSKVSEVENPNKHSSMCKAQLQEYFSGQRKDFKFSMSQSGTEFQQDVWAGLLNIPYGETESYGYLAKQISRPKAVRAVGAANGRNRLSIVIPCHRIIGANKTLTGYAGGLERKAWLLDHEAKYQN